jgi:crossover junction endodeoxyribonuclease RuvC
VLATKVAVNSVASIRILGIDPGSQVTGFGVIQQEGGRYSYVASGCIRLSSYEWPHRLKYLFEGLVEVIANYQPSIAAIEQVFVYKNVASALKLGQARGAALVAMTSANLIIKEYSARAVKKAVVGYGAADKQQVQQMIRALLQLNGLPPTDAADALAIALCHGQNARGSYL